MLVGTFALLDVPATLALVDEGRVQVPGERGTGSGGSFRLTP